MKITIGLLAHVDAGKTTFAEQLLYRTNRIRRRGRVDHKDAFMDSHDIERERGITVFADQAAFTYKGNAYTLIDTPGHVDFSPEMERSLMVMDYAVLVISAVEGVEGHAETVWQLLRKHRVPTFLFINKTDRAGADVEAAEEDIRRRLSGDIVPIPAAFASDGVDEPLAAALAERDEALLETYFAADYADPLWLDAMRAMVKQCRLFPCLHGSALQDEGIDSFLDTLHLLTETAYSDQGPFAARVCKIRHDDGGVRLTFLKALSGSLAVRDEVAYGGDGERIAEKATQIRLYNGSKFTAADRVSAGDLFAVSGLSEARAGDGAGALRTRASYELEPVLKAKVLYEGPRSAKEVYEIFRMLDAEDPSLHASWEAEAQEIQIRVMGAIQLEVLKRLVEERFSLRVAFGEPDILYRETIADSVAGYGHFEPLGHYAEVHLRLEPGERGSGLAVANACHPDELAVGYQHLVLQHLTEREHHGLLTGSPLTDVRITLLTGRAHNKHTSGGDFREAAFRALRQGLEKAENALLEPYYNVRIRAGLEHVGRVMSDIRKANGTFDPPETREDAAVVSGRVPVATFMHYGLELASYTQGKGAMTLAFGGYGRCHNEAEVIARIGYRKDADPMYTSSSIFCAKGQGFSVPWDEAERYMHAL